jgi:hypothetical protein
VPDANIVLAGSGANRTVTISPLLNQSGSTTITISVSDRTKTASASFVLQVLAVNDAPVAQAQSVGTQEDTSLAITLSASDVDNTSLSYDIVSGPRHGTLAGAGSERTYTPAQDYNGPDSFTFRASDGALNSNIATVSITVGGENDAPIAADDSAATDEDTALSVQVLANDTDAENDALNVVRVAITAATHGVATIAADKKSVRYVPAANFFGTASFTYTISDGALESTASVTVTVRPVNDAPVAQNQSLASTTSAPISITLGATDIDSPSSDISFSVLSQPTNGTLSGADSNLRYTARRGFSGTDSFTFRASDESLSSNTATITIRVSDTNAAPIARDDSASTQVGTPITLQVLANDTDADGDTLLISAVDATGTRGTLGVSADKRSVVFTPASGFVGATSFGYSATDGVASGSACVTITVTAVPVTPTPTPGMTPTPGPTATPTPEVTPTPGTTPTPEVTPTPGPTPGADNRAPIAVPDSYTTRGPLQVLAAQGVLKNDSDADGNALSARLNSIPANGTLNFKSDGSFVYTPSVAYSGRDSFTYAASDGRDGSQVVTVMIQVAAPRDVTPPQVTLAGAPLQVLRRLIPARGTVVDASGVRGSGAVYSSGLRSIVLQLQRGDGQYFNGRTFQRAPFNLRAPLLDRSFFALINAMPAAFPDGRYKWTAIATDNAGLIGRATQMVIVDATPPRLSITSPSASAGGVAQVNRLSEIVVSSGADVVRVDIALRRADGLYFNGRTFQATRILLRAPQIPSLVPSVFRLPLSLPSTPARYIIEARATDAAGNIGIAQRNVQVRSTSAS